MQASTQLVVFETIANRASEIVRICINLCVCVYMYICCYVFGLCPWSTQASTQLIVFEMEANGATEMPLLNPSNVYLGSTRYMHVYPCKCYVKISSHIPHT